LIDGEHTGTSQEEKHEIMFNYYDNLIRTALRRSSTLDLQSCHHDSLDFAKLESPNTKEEIWATIKTLPTDRAPRPNGFTGRFYKACWSVIKVDLMAAIITLQ